MNRTLQYLGIIIGFFCCIQAFAQCPPGDVAFFSQADVDDFGSTYPSCTTISGNLGVYGADITNLDGLSNITEITGYADFESDLSALTDWSGLDNLTTLHGALYFYTVTFSVLPTLNSLTTIGGDFVYRENAGVSNVIFPNITTINGYLDVGANPDMTAYAMPSLTTVGSLFACYSNPVLSDPDFGLLTAIGGYLYIQENNALSYLSGFSNLSSVGDYLSIEGNAVLTDISHLTSLLTINGYIQIANNPSLTSLSGLDNVDPLLLTGLSLSSNVGLATCNVPSLCTYLSNGGSASISGNAIGCLNAAQLVETCTTGCISRTTWNGTSWDNGVPTMDTAAVFTGNYTTAGDLRACVLIVQGADVTISSGNDFEIAGAISVDPTGSLTVENNANLIQIEDVANTGLITVKRTASMKRLDYVFWGSPVAGQDLKLFSPYTLSPTYAPGYTASIGNSRFYTLDEPTNSFAVIAEPLGVPFAAAKGYMVRAPNNFPVDFTPVIFNGSFSGTPNNGDVAIGITNTPGTGQGYNMLGNPYPSAIDADLFLAQNPGALYFWTHTVQGAASGANYASYTTFGAASSTTPGSAVPDGTIAVGQGFIHKTATTGTAVFTNNMRTGNNNAFFFRDGNTEKHRIWLNLSNAAGIQNQLLVGYTDGATTGVDASIDAQQIEGGINSICSLIGDEKFSIQALPLPFAANDVIPIGFTALADGLFTIAVDHLDGLFAADQDIYIQDHVLDTLHNLKQSPYHFAAGAGTTADRFSLVFQSAPLDAETPAFDPENIVVFNVDGVLNIHSGTTVMSAVKVFDISGRLVSEQSGLNTNLVALGDLRPQQQLLLVRIVSADDGIVIRKVLF